MLPLKLGGVDQFTAVREFFSQAGYSEPAACRRLGVGSLHEYLNDGEQPAVPPAAEGPDALSVLLRVFLAGKSVSRDLVAGVIPHAVRESMEALGILGADPGDPGQYCSPVVLYPVRGLYIASDRWKNPDGSPISNDYVFPAIHALTHDFLEFLPRLWLVGHSGKGKRAKRLHGPPPERGALCRCGSRVAAELGNHTGNVFQCRNPSGVPTAGRAGPRTARCPCSA